MGNLLEFLEYTDKISEDVLKPVSLPFAEEYPMLVIYGSTRVEIDFFREQEDFLYAENNDNRLMLVIEIDGLRKKLGYMEINFKNMLRLSSLKERKMELFMSISGETRSTMVDDQFYLMSLAMEYE